MKIVISIFLLFHFSFANPLNNSNNRLQEAIDKASPYSTLKLFSATYQGKITINKPITIIGIKDKTIIKGDNKGDVIDIKSSNVTLKNLTIIDSGDRIENLDSAIKIEGVRDCKILNCKISNCLYGINLKMVNSSQFIGNQISSKENAISLKGDAFKIWYSNHNIIKDNFVFDSRDSTLTYSNDNNISGNRFSNNRFGLEIIKSKNNLISNNDFEYNFAGIILMGVKDSKVINNQIKSSKGATGIGLVMDGTSKIIIENNIISFNAKAIYINSKHNEKEMQRYITNNTISYNGEALHFHEAIKNNTITHNKIFGNIEDIVKDTKGVFASYKDENNIKYNYWDRYAGFDKNKNEIGDTPYIVYTYSDRLWHYNHKIKFFYASPAMSIIDFIAKIAPFIKPDILFEDNKPIYLE